MPRGCVGYRHGVLVRARHPAGLRERRARLATPATPHVLWMRPPPDLPRIPEALVSPRRVAFRGGYSSWSGRIWNTDSGRFSGSSKFEQVPERSACRAIYRSRRVKPEKRPNCEIFCCPANSSPLSTRNHGALVGARYASARVWCAQGGFGRLAYTSRDGDQTPCFQRAD